MYLQSKIEQRHDPRVTSGFQISISCGDPGAGGENLVPGIRCGSDLKDLLDIGGQ